MLELDLYALAVKITVKIEQVGLQQHPVATDRWSNPDIHHRRQALTHCAADSHRIYTPHRQVVVTQNNDKRSEISHH